MSEQVDSDFIVKNLFTQNVIVEDQDGNMGQLLEVDAYLVGGTRINAYFPEALLPGLMQAIALTWQNHFPDTGMQSAEIDHNQLQQLLDEQSEGDDRNE